jgi:hypothetical protein
MGLCLELRGCVNEMPVILLNMTRGGGLPLASKVALRRSLCFQSGFLGTGIQVGYVRCRNLRDGMAGSFLNLSEFFASKVMRTRAE